MPGEEKKQRVQKHYMLTTVKEAHAMFKECHPDIDLSYSKFAKLRPPQVLLEGNIPHNSCLCKYHENIRLLLDCLRKAGHEVTTSFRDFIGLCLCDQTRGNCMSGKCRDCPGLIHLHPSDAIAKKVDEWDEWGDNKNTPSNVRGTVLECFEKTVEKMSSFCGILMSNESKRKNFVLRKEL